MTRTIIIATKAEYDALLSEEKNFLLTNQTTQPVNVGDTVLLQYIEPEVIAEPDFEDKPGTEYKPAVELEQATVCTYVTKGHPIAKGYQALTLKRKEA
jgi:hypothetical protein